MGRGKDVRVVVVISCHSREYPSSTHRRNHYLHVHSSEVTSSTVGTGYRGPRPSRTCPRSQPETHPYAVSLR